ncbi:hypothetical protein U1E44_15870 [Arenibacter sp. GZD96]|nr:hypothetical protein [Arenibacter sp. GZD-96]
MNKLFLFGVALILFISCKQEQGSTTQQNTGKANFDTQKFPKKTNIHPKANEILKNWPEFNAFQNSFDALYRIANEEDLKLVMEDLIEKQKLLEASDYPELFNRNQVKSRQKVLKTYILKIKGNLEYRIDNQEFIIEMLTAYNAFCQQFNVIVHNTLDAKLILNE